MCTRVCARVRVCARACASPCAAHTGHLGVHVLSATTLPGCLELGEFSFKPELLLGHPPRPTGGDDVCSLVARRVPRLPLPFIDRSGRSDVSSRTFGSAAPAETAPTPAPASPPRGGGAVMKSKPLGRGRGGSGVGGRGTPLCPLCPGAPECINSAVSSQTRIPSRTPPQCPPPRPLVT